MDERIQSANDIAKKLEQEVDIVVDQAQNMLLQQLPVQLHRDATIIPATDVCDACMMPFPKEEDDNFGKFYNEEVYIEFQQSLSLEENEQEYFNKKNVNYTNNIYNNNNNNNNNKYNSGGNTA